MSEEGKVKHILKGIEDDAFQMFLARNPHMSLLPSIFARASMSCVDKGSLRAALLQLVTLSGVRLPYNSNSTPESSLSVQIKDFIREEVARQPPILPLSDRPIQPDTSLAAAIRRAIHEELAESLLWRNSYLPWLHL